MRSVTIALIAAACAASACGSSSDTADSGALDSSVSNPGPDDGGTDAVDTGADGGTAGSPGGLADAGGTGGAGGAGGTGGGKGNNGNAPVELNGQFDLLWSLGDQAFTITGRNIKLTRHDDGPDETNYDGKGTIEISPTVISVGGTTCTLAAAKASLPWSEKYFFKVLKPFGAQTTYAQRWGFSNEWDYDCGGSPWPVIVNFRTGTGVGCIGKADVPATSATALSGSFDMTCMPPYTAKATWSFAP